jgi:hypothetical protein
MKTTVTAIGALIVVSGLIWAAQGAGWFPYPASSFMVDNSRWIYIGLATAAAGLIVSAVARRF